MNVTTPEPDPRDALHFPPAALPIQATESREIPDARPHGDCLDLGDVAKNDEVFHVGILDRTLGIRDRWTPQFSELVSTLAAGPKRCCPNDRRTFAMRVPLSGVARQRTSIEPDARVSTQRRLASRTAVPRRRHSRLAPGGGRLSNPAPLADDRLHVRCVLMRGFHDLPDRLMNNWGDAG